MFALVDVNSMYCACESVFRPDLKGKPIICLSNNDGCMIARSVEVKPYIKMGHRILKFNTSLNKIK